MEEFHKLVGEANRFFRTADHLAYVTYPFIKEPKMVLVVAENLYRACVYAMEAILYYDALYKRIRVIPSDFNSKYSIFRTQCAHRYGIGGIQLEILKELNSIVKGHEESPIEFVRNNKYLICSDGYKKIQSIDMEKLKDYIYKSRELFDKLNSIK